MSEPAYQLSDQTGQISRTLPRIRSPSPQLLGHDLQIKDVKLYQL